MKNSYCINEITGLTKALFDNDKVFDEFRLLLIDSGIMKDEIEKFFATFEGEIITGISSYELKLRLSDEKFLLRFTSNLYGYLKNNDDKCYLAGVMNRDGYKMAKSGEFQKEGIAFNVDYNDVDRILRINGIEIAKPQFNGENDIVFEYLFNHPNKTLNIVNDELAPGIAVGKNIDDIVKNLNFKGKARALFFPKLTKKAVEFRNPISYQEMRERGFDENLTVDDLFPNARKDKNR